MDINLIIDKIENTTEEKNTLTKIWLFRSGYHKIQ